MKVNSNNKLSLALTVLALGITNWFPQSVSAATLYSVLDLGSLLEVSNSNTFATGINDLGQVIGITDSLGRGTQAFRTAPNQPINPLTDDIDNTVQGLSNSLSSDIDNSGRLVGTYRGRGGQRDAGYLTTPNGAIDDAAFISDRANIDSVPFVTRAAGINELGQVVGTGIVRSGGDEEGNYLGGVLVNNANGSAEDIIQLGQGVEPEDINDLGQIVGTGNTSRAFRTAPGGITTIDLGTLGGASSRGTDINNLGQVVGSSLTADGELHAYLTAANQAINTETDDLGTLGGNFSVANSINELGQVVGFSSLANEQQSAFLYENGTMFDLNNLIDTTSNIGLTTATGINERGQIVANSFNRAYLLTPVPEPTTMLGALAFGAGAGLLRKKNNKN